MSTNETLKEYLVAFIAVAMSLACYCWFYNSMNNWKERNNKCAYSCAPNSGSISFSTDLCVCDLTQVIK